MKKKVPREIILVDKCLQRVRKNLRDILKLACLAEFNRWLVINDLYQEKLHQGRITPSQKKRWFYLARRHNELMYAYDRSILECNSGAACISHRELVKEGKIESSERSTNFDMVWVPHYKAWFCAKCYETYYKLKVCENCGDYNEKTVRVFECSLCGKYICDYCENYCKDCSRYLCDQCYHEHIIQNLCCDKKGVIQTKFH